MADPLDTVKQSTRSKTIREDPLAVLTEAIANQHPGPMSDSTFDATVNGPQGYPKFNKMFKFNDAGWDAFLANAPESQMIDDRRNESVDDFIARTMEARAR